MEGRIQATISALGYLERGVYYREPDCYDTIRDLIRYLRNDAENGLARQLCGDRNLIQNDLIPILKCSENERDIFDVALRLLINLCQPAYLFFDGNVPKNQSEWKLYLKFMRNLQNSKDSFADPELMSLFTKKMKSFLELEWEDREEEDRLVVERILALFRFLLSIPNTDLDKNRTGTDLYCHDRLLLTILDAKLDELFLLIASKHTEREFHVTILEIIASMLWQHSVSDIVAAGQEKKGEQKQKETEKLETSFTNEKKRTMTILRNLPSRHSNFAGSYTIKGLKALNSDKDVHISRVVNNTEKLGFIEQRKNKKKMSKNRRPFDGSFLTHRSTLAVRFRLREMCLRFLDSTYNKLMNSSKALITSRTSLPNCKNNYFFILQFFTQFCRLAGTPLKQISTTLGVESFHHVQTELELNLESSIVDKKQAKRYGNAAGFCLAAFKELLMILRSMGQNGDCQKMDEINRHIFYIPEYRELPVTILRRYNPAHLSKSFLKDLILATHVYMRLLEKNAKKGMVTCVRKRRRRRKARKNREEEQQLDTNVDMDGQTLIDKWDEISSRLSEILPGHELESNDEEIPYNALLEVDDDTHKSDQPSSTGNLQLIVCTTCRKFVMYRVQSALRQGRILDAVRLFRAARQIWPENDTFGSVHMEPTLECLELRAVHFADLSQIGILYRSEMDKLRLNLQRSAQETRAGDFLDDEMDGFSDEQDENEHQEEYVESEVTFDFVDYVGRFARVDILRWYIYLLNDWKTNGKDVNDSIVKMLHRISFDLNTHVRLYQATLFRILDQINAHSQSDSSLFEIRRFGKYLLRKYFADFHRLGPTLVCETLFWKAPKQCHEISHGYGTFDTSNSKSVMLWPEELDNELRSLHEEYVTMEEKSEGIDVADFVEHNLSQSRTRKQIVRQMKRLGLHTFGIRAMPRKYKNNPQKSRELIGTFEEDGVFAPERMPSGRSSSNSPIREPVLDTINPMEISQDDDATSEIAIETLSNLTSSPKLSTLNSDEDNSDDNEFDALVRKRRKIVLSDSEED